MIYDVIVVGAGPAGLTAALYAKRAEKSVLVLEKSTFGGQITYSPKIENYPGFLSMSGNELADKMVGQTLAQGAEIDMDTILSVEKTESGFIVQGETAVYEAKTVILALGAKHRMLGLEREHEFVGEGISYCAVCDGAFYKDMTVAVIGGGNSALQEAILLSEGCRKVYVIQNLPYLTGETKLADILASKENVEIIKSTVVTGLEGDQALSAIRLLSDDGKESTLSLDGMFVAIGLEPCNTPFEALAPLNAYGYFDTDESCHTATEGLFVAGDCRSKTIRQIATAIADGASAAIAACRYLEQQA